MSCRIISGLALALAWGGWSTARADLNAPGFEAGARLSWIGPAGGGTHAGRGGGAFVQKSKDTFVRSGKRAICLKIWNDEEADGYAWASISQIQPCRPDTRIRAGAWVYASSSVLPLATTGTIAQISIEYFSDERGKHIIPTHAVLSEPLRAGGERAPDQWHLLEVTDRVPQGARSLKYSIVLVSNTAKPKPQAVWVDDAFLEARGRGPAADTPPPRDEKRSWWRRLFN